MSDENTKLSPGNTPLSSVPVAQVVADAPQSGDLIARHPLLIRLCHWSLVTAIFMLLMSGLNILNTHPALYWGEDGHKGMRPVIGVEMTDISKDRAVSTLTVGPYRFDSTGIFGFPRETSFGRFPFLVSPHFMLPASIELGRGRAYHFFAAWLLVATGSLYMIFNIVSGRLRKTLLPSADQLTRRAIWADLKMHCRLGRHHGVEAIRYNLLQKIAYLTIMILVIPAMILTGLTMSTAFTAAFPELFIIFGGRQSARLIHFIGAILILVFVIVHIFQLFVAGFANEMRSMITGKFRVPPEEERE